MRIPGTNVQVVNSRRPRERSLALSDYISQSQDWLSFQGNTYALGLNLTQPGKPQEDIAQSFEGLVRGAYKSNGIVFSCVLARMALFSQGRFQWRRLRNGKPQDLFGTPALRPLEEPWPGGKTSDMLARLEQDNSMGGNGFVARVAAGRLRRLRPDWMTIVLGMPAGRGADVEPRDIANHPNSELVGYAYTPGGPGGGQEPFFFRPELVAHYAPNPDPEATYRGMSWITPVVIEIMGDKAASEHKLDFFERGGTPNMTVEYDPEHVRDKEAFGLWVEAVEEQVSRWNPSNRRLHLGMGTKANVVGSSFEEIEFKATQGAGETRIAAAAGVPPVVAGFSEGLQGSSLNEGNYRAAMRRFSDITVRWLWQAASDALATLVAVPGDAELWVDDRFIAALQDDRTDQAEVQGTEAQTIRTLGDGGWAPESVRDAVLNSDWSLLEHTGEPSVQTRPAETNGSGPPENVVVPAGVTDEEEA